MIRKKQHKRHHRKNKTRSLQKKGWCWAKGGFIVMVIYFALKDKLFEKGITGAELANELKIPLVVVNNLIHNKTRLVDLDVLYALCQFLACDIQELLVKEEKDTSTKGQIEQTYLDVYRKEQQQEEARKRADGGTIHYFVPKTMNINTVRIFLKGVQLYGDLEWASFKENILMMFRRKRKGLTSSEIQEKGLNVHEKQRMIIDYVFAEIKRDGYIQVNHHKPHESASLTQKGKDFLNQFE